MKNITNFIFELNQLKRQRHCGFKMAGVKNPYSVAAHIMRAAQIGYILAILEKANAEKVASIVLFHDNGEARIGDQDKISARYFSTEVAEFNAFCDQAKNLGKVIEAKLIKYFEEYEKRSTKEGIIAKDADWLEQAFQAKEYVDLGYKSAQGWIDNVEKAVETESAKKIIKQMKKTEFSDWWKDLKKMTYKKLG